MLRFIIRRRFASSAVLLEHTSTGLAKGNLAAIKAAHKADKTSIITGILISKDDKLAEEAKNLPGLCKILLVKEDLKLGESAAPVLKFIQEKFKFSHWFTVHSTTGKDLFPRFSGILGSKHASIADIINVTDENTFIRPIYAGNAIVEVEADQDATKILTVRSTAFQQDTLPPATAQIETLEGFTLPANLNSVWEGEEAIKSERPELGSAEVVVSGGRALKSQEKFKLIYDLADKLGAAVGASRAAVDAGYVPNELQVGQTGKVVAPRLYLAVGISGAIQHVAGMKDSQVIVAINKDTDCPIFKVADYGLVGDLFKIVPELTEKLPNRANK